MKMKHRALSVLLALAMVLTFMPALAFADRGEANTVQWNAWGNFSEDESDVIHIEDDEAYAFLYLYIPSDCEDGPFQYQWTDTVDSIDSDDENWISMETDEDDDFFVNNYVYEEGNIYLHVKDNNDVQEAFFYNVKGESDEVCGHTRVRLTDDSDFQSFTPAAGSSDRFEFIDGVSIYYYDGITTLDENWYYCEKGDKVVVDDIEYIFQDVEFEYDENDIDIMQYFYNAEKDQFLDIEDNRIWIPDWEGKYSVGNNKVKARIVYDYDEDDDYLYLETDFTLKVVNNPVKSISFQPRESYLYDIKSLESICDDYGSWTDDDGTVHTYLRYTIPFAPGDRLTVNTANGSKTYTYEVWYDGDDWVGGFKNANEKLPYHCISPYSEPDRKLVAGDYQFEIEYLNRTSKVPVKVVQDVNAYKKQQAAAAEQKRLKSITSVTINKATVSAAAINSAIAAARGSKAYVTTVVLGSKVKKIKKNAFKGTNVTVVEVKTKKLKAKSVKGSLKGSKVKTIKVKAGKKFKKSYKKIFTKKNAGKKVSVK